MPHTIWVNIPAPGGARRVRVAIMVETQAAALVVITLIAAIVNGALGYGFSSITVPIALLFLANRVLNPALVLIEAETLVLNSRKPAAKPENEAAVGEMVEQRGLLGDPNRIVPGQHDHHRTELHMFGLARHVR